jgi:hypothetical protein
MEIYDSVVVRTNNIVSSLDTGVERLVYTSTVGTIAVPHDRCPDEGGRTQDDRTLQAVEVGGRNMTLKELLHALSAISGVPAPRGRLPWSAAVALGYVDLDRRRGARSRTPDSTRMGANGMTHDVGE